MNLWVDLSLGPDAHTSGRESPGPESDEEIVGDNLPKEMIRQATPGPKEVEKVKHGKNAQAEDKLPGFNANAISTSQSAISAESCSSSSSEIDCSSQGFKITRCNLHV